MDKRPIRRKFKDNPYRWECIEKKQIYIINFMNIKGEVHSVQVNKQIFDVFDESERYENARIKEDTTKKIKSEINIENLKDNFSIEEDLINRMTIKELKDSISELPENQKRRVIKYYFEDKTLEEIAKEEHVNKSSIKRAIDNAIKNISKKFKN